MGFGKFIGMKGNKGDTLWIWKHNEFETLPFE